MTIKIIKKDGIEDSIIWDWFDKSYVTVDNVSKLKGLKIKVSGSSFAESMNTNKNAEIIEFFIIGIFILSNDFTEDDPKILEELIILIDCFSNPAFIGW